MFRISILILSVGVFFPSYNDRGWNKTKGLNDRRVVSNDSWVAVVTRLMAIVVRVDCRNTTWIFCWNKNGSIHGCSSRLRSFTKFSTASTIRRTCGCRTWTFTCTATSNRPMHPLRSRWRSTATVGSSTQLGKWIHGNQVDRIEVQSEYIPGRGKGRNNGEKCI